MKKEAVKSDFKKRLYFFTLTLIEFIDSLPNDNVSQKIGDELFGSGTAMIVDYIEAQSTTNEKGFITHINASVKSVNETKFWLALLRDSKRAKTEKIKWFLDELDDITELLETLLEAKSKKQKR